MTGLKQRIEKLRTYPYPEIDKKEGILCPCDVLTELSKTIEEIKKLHKKTSIIGDCDCMVCRHVERVLKLLDSEAKE